MQQLQGNKSIINQEDNLKLPSVRNSNKFQTLEIKDPQDDSFANEMHYGTKTNKNSHRYHTQINSNKLSPRDNSNIRAKNLSTLEPNSIRHQDLLNPTDNLVGLTAKNEWDEIWKYAKIKDQEENSIKKHKKLAQKIQFSSDLKAQILENNKRKNKELQESKVKEKEELEDFLKKIKYEDNKKMISKMKTLEQIKFNEHILLQKNKFRNEMRKEQKIYEKGLVNGLVIENSNPNKNSLID